MNELINPPGDIPANMDLRAEFLAGRSPETLRTYQTGLQDFADFCGLSINGALGGMLQLGYGDATRAAIQYRADLVSRDLAAATVNIRLVALRSAIRFARDIGLIDWELRIKNVHSEPYRDTRGPELDDVAKILDAARGPQEADRRDYAILRLLFDLGLRRGEVARMDVPDVDLEGSRVQIVGKGKTEAKPLTLPPATVDAISAWRSIWKADGGPLFINFTHFTRLSGRSIGRIVDDRSRKAGCGTTPHGLRHAAITTALDLTDGDVRAVRQFSRHSSVDTVLKYDDNRRDLAGEIARKVSGSTSGDDE